MASLTIRNLDDADKRELQKIAAANGRSMEEELRVTIKTKIRTEKGQRSESHLVDQLSALVEKYGPLTLELPVREAAKDPPDFR